MVIEGYKFEEVIYETNKSYLYKVYDEEAKKYMLAKLLKDEYPSREDIRNIREEYDMLSTLKNAYIPAVKNITGYNNGLVYFSEYVEGRSLRDYFQEHGAMPLDDFLHYAIILLEAVEALHKNKIIHKNLNIDNIFINTLNKTIKIVDFSVAQYFSDEKKGIDFEKSKLEFVSPEQTDNVNRPIDYRSDLYTLGIIYYMMLTNMHPFGDKKGQMELINAHTSMKALKIHPKFKIPFMIEKLIFILLEKNPENRYKSIYALKKDLERIKDNYKTMGYIEGFELSNDLNLGVFSIPKKLYGREKELELIKDNLESVVKGNKEVLFVKGYSGVGKTSLIEEIEKKVKNSNGFFVEGKYDQFQRSIPYYALSKAFSKLINTLLKKNKEELENWAERIKYALGPNGQVIADIIPEIEAIIGKQEPLPPLGSEESQNRFNLTLTNFIRVFAHSQHPLVIFIDDLQWADYASLSLISKLIVDKTFSYFYLVGAYRDNEVGSNHELAKELTLLKRARYEVPELHLLPLSITNINNLISDSIKAHLNYTLELAKIVHKKTKGNPFFVNQFLLDIYEKKFLYFNKEKSMWEWNSETIDSHATADNVIDLMVNRIEAYSTEVQELIKIASILGNQFPARHLMTISQLSFEKMMELVVILIKDDLFKSNKSKEYFENKEYLKSWKNLELRFLHDRVQQGAYKLIPKEKKMESHHKVASLLYNNDFKTDDRLAFDIIEHFNKAMNIVTNKLELKKIADLNLYCGNKAKESTAYSQSLNYYKKGLRALELSDIEDKRLKFNFEKGMVANHFLLNNIEKGVKEANILLEKTRDIHDRVEVITILILYYGGAGEMSKAIELAIGMLKEFKVKIPREPSKYNLLTSIIDSRLYLLGKSDDKLLNMKRYTSKKIETIFTLLKELVAPSYLQGESALLPYVLLQLFNFTLKYGNGPVASFAYSGYGLLWSKLGFPNEAYRFAKVALKYNPKADFAPMEARCYFMTGSFSLYWKEPYKDLESIRKIGFRSLVDAGEYFWASYIYLFGFWQYMLSTASIEEAIYMLKTQVDFAQKAKQIEPYYIHLLHYHALLNISSQGEENGLDFISPQEREAREYFKKNKTSTAGFFYHATLKLFVKFMCGKYEEGLEFASKEEISLEAIQDGTFTRVMYSYLYVMSVLLTYDTYEDLTLGKYYERYAILLKDLKKWNKVSKENFEFFYLSVTIQEKMLKEKESKLNEELLEMISIAERMESPMFTAIGNELYGRYLFKKGNSKLGMHYIKEASYVYYRCGAMKKVKSLEEKYSRMNIKSKKMAVSVGRMDEKRKKINELDLITLQKFSKTVRTEYNIEVIIEKFLKFLMENTGATKGALLLREDKDFVLKGKVENGTFDKKNVKFEELTTLPLAILRYTRRTKSTSHITDALKSKDFGELFLVKKGNIRSVLTLPLISNTRLLGLLYLENNMITHLFTEEKIELIELLATDIAIAIDNAKLYADLKNYNQKLEEKVNDRAKELKNINNQLMIKNNELNILKDSLQEKSDKITNNINYAKRIQGALFPREEELAEYFREHFIIHKPKDIVSGDFHLFLEDNNHYYFILGDCTGHGVAGAFISIISIYNLKSIISGDTNLEDILVTLDENIKETLKSEQYRFNKRFTYSDGLDVGIVAVDKVTNEGYYTGAKTNLYINRGDEWNKVEGTKKSIGGKLNKKSKEFRVEKLGVLKDLNLYITTDGYIDQNDEQGKKFGIQNFEKLLTQVSKLPFKKQKEILLKTYTDFKKSEIQRDDISVIGLKI